MTENNKIFLDTSPFIYFLDNNIHYAEKMMRIFDRLFFCNCSLVTSVLSAEEYLVYPYRTNNQEKVKVFFEFIKENGIKTLPITSEIAEKAARIRAEFPFFKAMDALQLASSVISGCDFFLTNDKQLKQFQAISCVTVDEWQLDE